MKTSRPRNSLSHFKTFAQKECEVNRVPSHVLARLDPCLTRAKWRSSSFTNIPRLSTQHSSPPLPTPQPLQSLTIVDLLRSNSACSSQLHNVYTPSFEQAASRTKSRGQAYSRQDGCAALRVRPFAGMLLGNPFETHTFRMFIGSRLISLGSCT